MYVSPNLKAVGMVVAAILAGVSPYLASGHQITQAEMVNVLLIALGAVNVYLAPNLPGSWANYTKAIITAATAAGVMINTYLGVNGTVTAISPAEWAQVGLSVLAVLGVYQLPNTTSTKVMTSSAGPPSPTNPQPLP